MDFSLSSACRLARGLLISVLHYFSLLLQNRFENIGSVELQLSNALLDVIQRSGNPNRQHFHIRQAAHKKHLNETHTYETLFSVARA